MFWLKEAKKKVKISEDLLNQKEDKIAAIEHVNELFFTAQYSMTAFAERSNSEKINVPRRYRKRKLIEQLSRLQQKLLK